MGVLGSWGAGDWSFRVVGVHGKGGFRVAWGWEFKGRGGAWGRKV